MSKMKNSFIALAIAILSAPAFAADGPEIIIRVDDLGMNHTVNMAVDKLGKLGIPMSMTVMTACPWYQESFAVLKKHPHISVGVHLALTSEWKNYRWGPVLGKGGVPSLVDENGYFFATHAAFDAHMKNIKLKDVEKELRAQLDRAVASGVKIEFMDPHMGVARKTPAFQKIFEKLAKEYKLAIPGYFGEQYVSVFSVPVTGKTKALIEIIKNAPVDKPSLVVFHVGLDTPEMNALRDMDHPDMQSDKPLVSMHRQAEFKALTSKKFLKAVKKREAKLITYRDIISSQGLESMKKPPEK